MIIRAQKEWSCTITKGYFVERLFTDESFYKAECLHRWGCSDNADVPWCANGQRWGFMGLVLPNPPGTHMYIKDS